MSKVERSFVADLGMQQANEETAPYGVPRVTQRHDLDRNGKVESVTIKCDFPPTEQAARILTEVLPEMLQIFLEKNQDYADSSDNVTTASEELGSAGQYAELRRKMGKLKRSLWDRVPLQFEQPQEVLQDFGGHVLLALLFVKDHK